MKINQLYLMMISQMAARVKVQIITRKNWKYN